MGWRPLGVKEHREVWRVGLAFGPHLALGRFQAGYHVDLMFLASANSTFSVGCAINLALSLLGEAP